LLLAVVGFEFRRGRERGERGEKEVSFGFFENEEEKGRKQKRLEIDFLFVSSFLDFVVGFWFFKNEEQRRKKDWRLEDN